MAEKNDVPSRDAIFGIYNKQNIAGVYLIEDMEDKYTGIRRNAAIQNPIINEI